MVCGSCGAMNPAHALYCGSCGAQQLATCASCGSTFATDGRYCEHCGADRDQTPYFTGHAGRESIAAPVHLPRHLAKRLLESRAAADGERKQITVLFADMKGSTNLIQDLDPEQVEERLRPTLQSMIDAVHRYEGTVNRIEGDGIMALFGAPFAYEDSAVRAAYAALDMQNAMRTASDHRPEIRVGLHAGEVLVRTVHTDLSVDYDAIGATVHLAARMEQMAAPGSIYCTADVARLAEGLIEVRPLGPTPVKGFRDPLELFEITAHTTARTRWEATAARGLTQFVSRDAELVILRAAMTEAASGQGRLIGVVGEPGTGKSRLVHEMLQSPEAADWTVLKTTSASYNRNTPYHAFVSMIRSWCGISEQAGVEETKQRIHARIAALDDSLLTVLPAIHSLLDLPVEAAEWLALEPTSRRQRIQAAAKALVLRGTEMRPLLLWFEDMQWTDVETRSLLETLAAEAASHALLIVMTYRPEYEHKWVNNDRHLTLRIEALDQPAARLLVLSILGSNAQNDELCALIVKRTDGIPLFIEETVRSLVEHGALQGHKGAYTLIQALPAIRISDSVRSVIASRVDRLPPEQKDVLQTASVIGADIPLNLLEAIARIGQTELRTLLADLQVAEFLYEVPNTQSFQLRFKHALTHEVVYGSLLIRRQQELHGRIVRAMETQYGGNIAEVVESLAHHAASGGLWPEALRYARHAGQKAVELSAYGEARVFFEQALHALTHLPQDRAHIQIGIDIRLGLRAIFGATTEFPALEACLREAEALAISIDDNPRLAAISVAQTFVHNWRGDLDASISSGERGLRIAREIADHRLELSASLFLGQAYLWRGNFQRCRALLQPNRSWTGGPLRHERIGTTGTSSVLWLGMLSASHAYLGYFDDAIATSREACIIADDVRRPYDMALAHWYAGFVLSYKGDIPGALVALEHAYQICRAAQISFLIPVLSTSLGFTYALAGRADEGIALLGKAIEFSQSAKLPYGVAWSTVYLGFARLLNERVEGLKEQATTAIDLAVSHHYRAVEATARRLLASVLLYNGEMETAEACFLEARTIAAELGLQPEFCHCQSGLAQTCARLGKMDAAAQYQLEASRLYERLQLAAWPTLKSRDLSTADVPIR